MEFLIENNLVENNPDAVAAFLFNGEGLNKTSIGTYLGEK
jgi:cytohesin